MIAHITRGKLDARLFWTPWKRWAQWRCLKTTGYRYAFLGPVTVTYRRNKGKRP